MKITWWWTLSSNFRNNCNSVPMTSLIGISINVVLLIERWSCSVIYWLWRQSCYPFSFLSILILTLTLALTLMLTLTLTLKLHLTFHAIIFPIRFARFNGRSWGVLQDITDLSRRLKVGSSQASIQRIHVQCFNTAHPCSMRSVKTNCILNWFSEFCVLILKLCSNPNRIPNRFRSWRHYFFFLN